MPAYKKTSKYNPEDVSRLKVTLMMVLDETGEALTTSELQTKDLSIANFTTQKIASVLNELVDMGLVQKIKPKTTGRMKYMAMSKFLAEIGG